MTIRRNRIAATALAAALMAAATQAGAGIKNGQDTMQVVLGGQVNRALLYVDDGKDSDAQHVDNENDSTRFFMEAEGRLSEAATVGLNITLTARSNPSNEATYPETEQASSNVIDEDTLEFFLRHKRFGTLYLGQGSTATDGISETDLSGTGVAGYSSISDVAGGYKFVNSSTGARSGPAIADVADNLDGLGTVDRVRWDSPEIGGFQLRLGSATSGAVDTALTYAGDFGGAQVEAAVGYFNASSMTDNVEGGVSGSVSVRLANGVNGSVAAGRRGHPAAGRDDPTFVYVKLGHSLSLNSLGATSFALDYGRFDDFAQNGDTMNTIGFQAVQEIEGTGVQFYLAVRNHSLDRTGTSYDDILAVMAGGYVPF